MCQVCFRDWLSWPFNPLCRQFSWWAHCSGILSWLKSYSDCLCILHLVFLCFWYHKSLHSIFAFLVHQLYSYAQKIVVFFFSDGFEWGSFVYGHFHFFFVWLFSAHDILIILLICHISAPSSLLSRSFVSVQHSHPRRTMDHYVGFQSVDFCVNSDISVREDGLRLRLPEILNSANIVHFPNLICFHFF